MRARGYSCRIRFGQTLPAVASKRVEELEQEVVIPEAPVLADTTPDRFPGLGQDLATRRSKPGFARRTEIRSRRLQAVEGAEERIGRQVVTLLAGVRERLRSVATEQALRRQEGLGIGEQRFDRGQFGLCSRSPELASAEPVPIQHSVEKRLPVLAPFGLDFLERGLPRRLPTLDGNLRGVAAFDPKIRFAPPPPDPAREVIGPESPLQRVARERPRGAVHAPAPEVVRRSGDELAIVAAHLESEREPSVEGELGEHPLTETVDGEDIGPVDVPKGGFESPGRRLRIERGVLPPAGEEFPGLGALPGLLRHERMAGVAEGSPDPFAQLGRRGPGERHHEDLVEPAAFPGHEAGDDASERPGLAGAGARFDERHAGPGGGGPVRGLAGDGRPTHCTAFTRGTSRSVASSSETVGEGITAVEDEAKAGVAQPLSAAAPGSWKGGPGSAGLRQGDRVVRATRDGLGVGEGGLGKERKRAAEPFPPCVEPLEQSLARTPGAANDVSLTAFFSIDSATAVAGS